MDICGANDSFLAAVEHIRERFLFALSIGGRERTATGDPNANLRLRSEPHTTGNDCPFRIPLALVPARANFAYSANGILWITVGGELPILEKDA